MQHPSETPRNTLKGILLIVAAGAVLASMDGIGKYLIRDNPVPVVLWGRYFFHSVLTFAVLGAGGSFAFLRANRPGLQTLRAGFLLGATATLFLAISHMPLADATAIQFLAPVLVTAFSVPILGEVVGFRRWAAVLCGFAGVLLIVRPGMGEMEWVSLLPLLTAVSLSLYMIMTRVMRDMDRPATTVFYTTATGAVVLSALMPFVWAAPSPHAWLLMMLMGGLGACGHYFLIKGFAFASASVLAPFTYTHLLCSLPISLLVFGDVPDTWMLSGTGLIVASGLYVWFRETYGARQRD